MRMYVKLYFKDLNLDPYFSHPTNTYTSEITVVPKMNSRVEC